MNERELRRFIITRFVWTSVIVAVVEFVMVFTVINMLIPLMINGFFPQIVYVTSLQEFGALPTATKWIILGTALGVLVLALLPLSAGAYIYSMMVTRKLKEYEKIREEERSNEQKQRYLMISDIAHDLKTPMTTVTGYAKALSDGMVAREKEQEYLDAIKDKTLRMNDIVQMLFDYVRLDSEGFSIVKAKIDICELLRECVAALYQDIENAGDDVDIDIPEDKIMIEADKVQLTRVINNLITNAVKHNAGNTTIGVTVRQEPDEVRVYVADTGEAIEEELARELFEPFVMGDKSRSSGGGSGLGLSVASKIMNLHGYKLKLVQKPEMLRYKLDEKYNKVFIMIMKVPEG